jgi:hypothetical protein
MAFAEIDEDVGLHSMKCGLPSCLHVPIAARSRTVLDQFVGTTSVLSSRNHIMNGRLLD